MKVFGTVALALSASEAAAFVVQSTKRLLKPLHETVEAGVAEKEQKAKTLEDKLAARLADLDKKRAADPMGSLEHDSRDARALDKKKSVTVQGGSLRTWSLQNPAIERVEVVLGTDDRPLDSDIEIWHGPDNTPQKMRVYSENGLLRPVKLVIETPRNPSTVAIRNTGPLEFPVTAFVSADPDADPAGPLAAVYSSEFDIGQTIQGGALRTFPFDPFVESVRILLTTAGRPLNARIELLQGPNNNKEVVELYTEDGMDRPFFMVIDTPDSGNVIRVVNSATVEFPLTAWVEPYIVRDAALDESKDRQMRMRGPYLR